jgi:DNA polymerase III epsilon subunit-like protein
MRIHNLAFIDIETTGLNILEHEILEIGCIVTNHKLKILKEFEIKIKPEHLEKANKTSMKINHYDEEKWKNAYPLEKALKFFSLKVKNCIMIGQNVAFDSAFLEYNFAKLKMVNTLHYHRLDTISIAWAKFNKDKKFKHFSLREMCRYFSIENENPHSALSDARATYELYKKLMSL